MNNYIDSPVSNKTLPPKNFLEHLLQRFYSVDASAEQTLASTGWANKTVG